MFQQNDILYQQNPQRKCSRFIRFSRLQYHSTFTCAKQFEKVIELAMNVATDGDGTIDGLNIGFFKQYFFNLLADESEIPLV